MEQYIRQKLGFEVVLYEREDFACGVDNVAAFHEKYDMVIYIGNVENASRQSGRSVLREEGVNVLVMNQKRQEYFINKAEMLIRN